MTQTAIARTARYMTHLVVLDANGAPERLACQPNRALPKATRIDGSEHVVCNRCSGALR